MSPSPSVVRFTLGRLVKESNLSLAELSRRLGRDPAYLQQYVKRGSPKRLDDLDRLFLANTLMVDERVLGARDPWSPAVGLTEDLHQLPLL
ncbi:helix-turn-helix domain-containing protein [Sphingomonas crocodyli]|uniref:XRE family transcriptional regulator n=1 Tax=Sphingomonas crocodyli TaxID=1979270 RepID=A0A437LXR7_9SPHN|nr:helix-turn-helix transcriptional regulator [Sphingomonas crocodyli]RVT90208.1 hypothetical protein EOD43_18090 [Sphingomonas crocodyli]